MIIHLKSFSIAKWRAIANDGEAIKSKTHSKWRQIWFADEMPFKTLKVNHIQLKHCIVAMGAILGLYTFLRIL